MVLLAGLALFCVTAVPIACIGYSYFRVVDDVVTEGEAYGFEIGQTKMSAYRAAQAMFVDGEVESIRLRANRKRILAEEPWLRGPPIPFDQIGMQFERWCMWTVEKNGQPLVTLYWEGNRLSKIRFHSDTQRTPGDTSVWKLGNATIRIGESYSEVRDTLKGLGANPQYREFGLSTGWLSRRGVVDFTNDEFSLIEPHDEWMLLVRKDSFLDGIDLTFSGDDRLIRIHRHRQRFEIP